MKATTQQRLSPMDCMKGLAILMVVLGHNFYFGVQETNGVTLFAILSIIQIPIFVFVSGYFTSKPVVAPWHGKEFISYWKSRAIRLLLPLLVTPFLFRLFSSGGEIGWPTYEIFLGKYWFTFSLFVLFTLFYVARLLSQILMSRLDASKVVLVECVLLLLSAVVIDLLARIIKTDFNILNRQLEYVHWLYKYLVWGHIVGRSASLQSLLKRPETTALATFVFAITVYSPLNDLEYFNYDGGGIYNLL